MTYRLLSGIEIPELDPEQVRCCANVLECLGGAPGPMGEDAIARVLIAALSWRAVFDARERQHARLRDGIGR